MSRGSAIAVFIAIVLVGARTVVTVSADEAIESERWVAADIARLTVISDADVTQSRNIVGMVEQVRTVLAGGHKAPALVIAVRDGDRFKALLPKYWAQPGAHPVGAYWSGPFRHCIVVKIDRSRDEMTRRIVHEYMHLLTHLDVPDAPPWFDEGMSELWGASVIHGDSLEIGHPVAAHLNLLKSPASWIPLEELLAMQRLPDSGDKRRLATFYAESWALVHYLTLGGTSSDLRLKLPAIANPTDLERALKAYIAARRFRAVALVIPPADSSDEKVRLEELPRARALAIRAACIADGERPTAALPLLEKAIAIDPNDPEALETLGYVRFQQNLSSDAARWFDRAIATGSASHLAYFYRAIIATVVPGSRSPAEYLMQAIEVDPAFAPAFAKLAEVKAHVAGQLEEAVSLLRRATELEPQEAVYWVDLGRLLLRLNRPSEARVAAERGRVVARSAASRHLVESFLEELEKSL